MSDAVHAPEGTGGEGSGRAAWALWGESQDSGTRLLAPASDFVPEQSQCRAWSWRRCCEAPGAGCWGFPGTKQGPTSPPSYGASPVTLLATTPQDRQTDSQPAVKAAGPRTEALGPSQWDSRGCKPVCCPTPEPQDRPPRDGHLEEDLRQENRATASCYFDGGAGGVPCRMSVCPQETGPGRRPPAHLPSPLAPEPGLRAGRDEYAFHQTTLSQLKRAQP